MIYSNIYSSKSILSEAHMNMLSSHVIIKHINPFLSVETNDILMETQNMILSEDRPKNLILSLTTPSKKVQK